MNSELITSAAAGGYSENLIKFLGVVPFTWNERHTVDAVKAGMPEREVVIRALQNDFGESDSSRSDAEDRYHQNCDAAGNFRFARFFEKKPQLSDRAAPGLFG